MTLPFRPDAPATGQRALVVVGPGRSGTSTITRGLAAAGIVLGDRLKPGMRKNAKGFFEDLDMLEVNYQVHEALGLRRNGSSVAWIDPAAWRDADLAAPHDRASAVIRERFGTAPAWGFKCGGVMRVLPFWQEVMARLDQEVSYVLAIRNPLSIARSRQKLDPHRGRQEKSDLEFLAQIIPYLPAVLKRPTVVVDYDAVMADPARQIRRLISGLALPQGPETAAEIARFASDFVSADLRHNRTAEEALATDPRLNPLTRDLYRALLGLARDEVGPGDPALQTELRRIEQGFRDMAPVLRLVDALEGELRQRGRSLGALWRTASQHMPTLDGLAGLGARMTGRTARAR